MSTGITDARAALRRAITATEATWNGAEKDAVMEELRLLRRVEDLQTERLNRQRVAQVSEARP